MVSPRRAPCFRPPRSTPTGAPVTEASFGLGRIRTATIVLGFVVLTWPREIQGQVGLASGEARVALVAIAPAHTEVQGVSLPRLGESRGHLREASFTLRLTSNNGYRLVVRRTGANSTRGDAAGRVWVRGVDGDFHELTPGSPVTIADQRPAGEHEREVLYRIQDLPEAAAILQALPVYYDIAVKPVM